MTDQEHAPRAARRTTLQLESRLQQLEDLVVEAKAVPFSATVRLNRDQLDDVLAGLRECVPGDVIAARRLLVERDDVMSQARADAEAVVDGARAERDKLVSESSVVVAAQQEADRVVAEGHETARQLRIEAEDYVDSQLANFEVVLQRIHATVQRGREKLRGRLDVDALAEAVAELDEEHEQG